MKKQEFIQELTQALAPVDAQTRADIISDINEHFAEGAAQDYSEEEICKNLGQPSQIAEQVLEEYNASRAQHGNTRYDNAQHDHSSHWGNHDHHEDSPWPDANNIASSIGNLVGNIGGMVGDFVGNISNMGIGDATRVKGGYEININEAYSDVTNLDITLNVCNLNIMPAPQGESIRVNIQGRSKHNNIEIENKNGCLTIVERHPTFRFELFGFKTSLDATIYVPASFNGDIRAKASIGNITVTGISGSLALGSSIGFINISRHNGSVARLRASVGEITLTDCTIDHVNAKASAGAIKVEGQALGTMKLSSSADTVKVRADKIIGNANLSSSAANVQLEASEIYGNITASSSADRVTIKASKINGDTSLSSSAATVYLEAREVEGNITASSSADNVHMRLPRNINCRIKVKKPTFGSLTNYLEGNPQSPYVLRASTSVGSIILEALPQ